MDTEALWLTLRLAGTTTVVLLAVALPLAWWIASGSGVARALVQAVVALPLVLPPTVIGFYLLVGLGPLTPVGRAVTRMLGHSLAFSFAGLLLGSILYSLPFAVQPLVAGFQSIGREYVEAASMLGASPLRSFFDVVLPMSRPALVTAAVLSFTHTVGEFGVVLMLGGNIPGRTRTLSVAIFDQVQDAQYADASRTALVLVAFSVVALLAIYTRRGWRGVESGS
ncbi:molybdate transport system permease protein [Granulicella rosea]|uniref:Molybdenum transport system permease n=1 Tax=Granulicella rosea TaxID=474952 RepID=A0A239H706_9BACT|nr:molybdate ABC transporter permease subunit [Granulicella rosea]SNS77216.1 molybdate transport system permease protein [Granulicella rosea]